MNLITIIPIARGIGKETLTYFSSESPLLGSIVSVPLRNKKISGIVTAVGLAELKKSELKNLPYGIKKMDSVKSQSFLLPEFIEAAQNIPDYYACTTGAVLSVLIPKAILTALPKIDTDIISAKSTLPGEAVAFQANTDERYSTYRSTIREEFAKKHSVFVCLPSREEIKTAEEHLHKGIEQYTFVLHNGLTPKDVVATWKKILATEHPVVIIATGYFLCIPRQDIRVVIVENESSRTYVQPARPFLDFRMVAEMLGKKMGWKVVLSDTLLRVETIWREKESDIAPFTALKYRVMANSECILADMRTKQDQEKKQFEIIGEQLMEIIGEAQESHENTFLFCSRKGLSPLTVCADCGETVSCNVCNSPVVLYQKKSADGSDKNSQNIFVCHVCGEKQPADVLCKRCGSWKLTTLGIGIETAERELRKKFPDAEIFIMDKDHITTYSQAEKVAKKFAETPGSILLGTEMALPYVKNTIGYTGVVSLDSFLSIPDWKIREKIMSIILSVRGMAEKKCVVQTRRPDESVFEYAIKGNLSDFYKQEIDERKKYGYPPFNTFIKISLEGLKSDVRGKMEKVKEELLPLDLNIFEAFHARAGRNYMVHGLLVVPRDKWPDITLLSKLRNLSPQFIVKIDPDSLL